MSRRHARPSHQNVRPRQGQGATEYLVLLAVVLIVAMVALGLLSYFPGLAGDAKISQSNAYWQGEARPFEVTGAQQVSTGNFTMVVQNADADTHLLTAISISGGAVNGNYTPTVQEEYFTAGESRVFSIPITVGGNPVGPGNPACAPGQGYDYYINFTYTSSDGTIGNEMQFGVKTLSGKCD